MWFSEPPILPSLAPSGSSLGPKRQRGLRFHDIVRFVARRRLKFLIFVSIITLILIITLLRESLIKSKSSNGPLKTKAHFEVHTLRTVVGKYIGPKLDWGLDINDSNLNSNNYDPDPKLGDDGRPVYLPDYPKNQMQSLYSINRFNLAVSDKISVDRKLPDPRKTSCRKRGFDLSQLPNTSVIIVFHNEAWSTLVRTVHSILNTSPQHLLAEILLVDDASSRAFLGDSLEHYMNNLGSIRGVTIKIIRSKQRIGLIRSRLLGVEVATGKVLTFIDAHCEATTGWLEPLMEQVKLDRKLAACPIIDIINEDNFAFTRSFELHIGSFNWGLNFRWFPISKREIIASNGAKRKEGKVKFTELVQPFRTPVMAGGLFSIERDYFNEIGKYDPQMDIWGGENIELSLRLWQCGGQIKIVPCSHVAHIFRKSSPYTFRPGKEVGDVLYTNLARVAEVWMDSWRDFFFMINPLVNKTLDKVGLDAAFDQISSRKQLRKSLDCKDFGWFLENVWPEHFFPTIDRFFGKVKQDGSEQCLLRPAVRAGAGQAPVGAARIGNCSSKVVTDHLFIFNPKTGFLMTDENVCLDSGSDPIPSRQVILAPCSESTRQKWEHTTELLLKHVKSGLCLDSSTPNKVHLSNCESKQPSMRWKFVHERWH